MHPAIQELHRRLPASAASAPHGSGLYRLDYAVKAAAASVQRFHEARATIDRNVNLSPRGKALEAVKPATEELAKIEMQRTEIARVREQMEARKASYAPPKPDPNDVAGAMLRQEIRSYVRSMSPADRIKFLAETDSFEALQAVFHAPKFLTGIDEDIRSRVLDKYRRDYYGDEIDELNDEEAAMECASAALEMAAQIIERGAVVSDG